MKTKNLLFIIVFALMINISANSEIRQYIFSVTKAGDNLYDVGGTDVTIKTYKCGHTLNPESKNVEKIGDGKLYEGINLYFDKSFAGQIIKHNRIIFSSNDDVCYVRNVYVDRWMTEDDYLNIYSDFTIRN